MAGSGGENGRYLPQLTSYDYDAPISEAGASGQPGIGGPNKFEASPILLRFAPAVKRPDFPFMMHNVTMTFMLTLMALLMRWTCTSTFLTYTPDLSCTTSSSLRIMDLYLDVQIVELQA